MLPTEAFKMRHLLTFSLTNAIQNAKSFFKNCELFVFGDVHYVTNALSHCVKNSDTLLFVMNCTSL
jgi:hypothetical protein